MRVTKLEFLPPLTAIILHGAISMTIYHIHHIIPRHAGGTSDPNNLVKLTIEEHAEAHRVLYETHGRWQDFYAWQGLSGQISMSDEKFKIFQGKVAEAARQRVKDGTHHLLRRADGTSVVSDLVAAGTYHMLGGGIQGKTSRRRVAEGTHNWLGDGSLQRSIQNKLVKEGAHHFQNKVKKECPHCNKLFDAGNYTRYHGDKCKSRI